MTVREVADLGDGATATGQSVTHGYDSAGEYATTLTVTDEADAADTDSVTVTVGGFEGYCGSDDNYSHVQAGRAYTSGGYAYAEGSDEQTGLNNTFYIATLKATSEGYFEIVSSCQW